jgi:hypothetical protein
MTTINTSRRLPSRVIDADIDSLNGLGIVNNYVPVRDEASPPELKKARELMQTRQQEETKLTVTLKAATQAARQAEWDFHNAVIAMKESVKGQFGADSDAAQAVGFKKKSEYNRRYRRKASPEE